MTKADAETICAFHEGWLVDMDEGRGDHSSKMILVMMVMVTMALKIMAMMIMVQVLRRTT